MKNLLVVALSFGLASSAFAFGAAESSAGSANQAFSALSGFRLRSPLRRYDATTVAPALGARVSRTASKYVTLRGFVSVSGQAFVSGQQGYVFITVTGDTQLQDNEGHYVSGMVTVSDSSGYYVSGNYLSGWPRPSATVTLYKGGRYLGTIRVDGSIPVQGFNSGGWVRVSGSGWVQGSGYINDDAP